MKLPKRPNGGQSGTKSQVRSSGCGCGKGPRPVVRKPR